MFAWKGIADEVSSWANITPPPANFAMQAVASLIKVTSILVEGHQLAKQQRKWVENMANKAFNVASMIQVHAAELRNNRMFLENVESVKDIVNRLCRFAEKRQKSFFVTRAFRAFEDQSTLRDYERKLDEVVSKFTADLVHIADSCGPHQLIKHIALRTFWKYRLRNPHKIEWLLFWNHFLDEQKGIANIYFKDNPDAKAQIEKRSQTPGVVTPYDISQIFKDPSRSIAWHIQDALGLEQLFIPSSSHQISNVSRVYTWRGHIDGDIRAELNLEMYIAPQGTCHGYGTDDTGSFILEGELDEHYKIKFSKLYDLEKICIAFEGILIDGNEINGKWAKRPLTSSCNVMPNGRGQFLLKEAQTSSKCQQQVYEMQKWIGKYIISSNAISISAKVLFLRYEHQVQGSGDDEHGHFFCQGFLFPEPDNTEASILVRYQTNNRPNILFKGILVDDGGKSRMEGVCFCPPEAREGCGTFMLELTDTHINLP